MLDERVDRPDFKTYSPFNLRIEYRVQIGATQGSMVFEQRQRNFKVWAEIVQAYPQCDLTEEGDKLIAISAIAIEMKPLM